MRRLCVFALLCFSSILTAQQALFPALTTYPGSFDSGQISVDGDFNGDGVTDVAFTALTSSENGSPLLVVELGSSSGSPTSTTTSLSGCTPLAMAAADVNQDHLLDLLLVCSEGSAQLFLGKGDGTFQAPANQLVPSGTFAVALADFNGDGYPDAAYASAYNLVSAPGATNGYAIALNTGAGNFATPATSVSLNATPSMIAASDLNGDGKLDLVFKTSYVLGNGNGTFGAARALPTSISQVAIADFNGDGYADMAYTLATSSNPAQPMGIYLLTGGSSGLSAQPTTIASSGFEGAGLLAVSLPGSSNLDILALDGGFSVLYGNGAGGFSVPLSYANPGFAVADINADGIPDVVGWWEDGPNPLTVTYANSDGTFQGIPSTLISSNLNEFEPTTLLMIDMNGDRLPDAVMKVGPVPQVLLSSGDGRFTPAAVLSPSTPTDNGTILLVADFDGDGRPDVVSIFAGNDHQVCGPSCPQPAQFTFYHGNGDGTLGYGNQATLAFQVISGAVAGDFNGDGKMDLVVSYFDTFRPAQGIYFFAGNGDGTFATPVSITLFGDTPLVLTSADLNGDKKLDLVVTEQNQVLSYLGNGDGTFSPVSQALSGTFSSPTVADVTGDGIPDLVVVSGATLSVYAGIGDGSFASAAEYSTPTGAGEIQVGDVNGDGLPDICANAGSGGFEVFISQGSGNFALDTNPYYAGVNNSTFALTQLNSAATYSGPKQYLDAVFETTGQTGLIGLLNLHQAPPPLAPNMTISASSGQSTVEPGQSVTVTVGLSGPGMTTFPGNVTFYVNQKQVATSSVAQDEASAQIQVPGNGLILVTAVYSTGPGGSSSTASLTLTSVQPTTTALIASANTAAQGVSITLTATVKPQTTTGTVSFVDGATVLGTGNLTTSGAATFSTSGLAIGTHSITAAYAGDSQDAASVSAASTVTVTAATFQLSASPSQLTIAQGATGSTTITVTPVGVYDGNITFACAGLPQYATCTFAPSTLAFSSAASQSAQIVKLTIATDISTQASGITREAPLHRRRVVPALLAFVFCMPLAFFAGFKQKKWGRRGLCLLITGFVLFLVACGSGGSNLQSTKTPLGTSTIVVSTGGSAPSLNLTVTISQ
ncbi:MAG TPA: FG-GAP-like repeat-containing protein [Terracidiphilus sp.]|nr:FG-GAP-like repeat-containing protein [Terracidiphilus sp.]